MRHSIPLIASLLALTAVAAPRANSITIRTDRLDSDYLNYGAQPQFAGVGRMLMGNISASGTLIRPRWVLTAAHVADDAPTSQTRFQVNAVSYFAAQTIIYPTWNPADLTTGDLALIKLASAVPGIPSVPIYSAHDELGKIASYTGCGLHGTGVTGGVNATFDTLKRAGQNTLDNANALFLYATFDPPPTSPTCLDLECGIALGDSGSGMFLQVNNTWYIAGINSWVHDTDTNALIMTYTDFMATTRLSNYKAWIEQTIRDACPADLDGDGVTTGADLALMLGAWGPCPAGGTLCAADLNGDGAVGAPDLAILLGAWGPCP